MNTGKSQCMKSLQKSAGKAESVDAVNKFPTLRYPHRKIKKCTNIITAMKIVAAAFLGLFLLFPSIVEMKLIRIGVLSRPTNAAAGPPNNSHEISFRKYKIIRNKWRYCNEAHIKTEWLQTIRMAEFHLNEKTKSKHFHNWQLRARAYLFNK